MPDECDVIALQRYIFKLTTNKKEKSYHSLFYETVQNFIKKCLPEVFAKELDIRDWDQFMLKELVFASQFFLLPTQYSEPGRKYKIKEIRCNAQSNYHERYREFMPWMSFEHYLAAH